jgi:PAT family beta-lactamase induction signal transducer AmpG
MSSPTATADNARAEVAGAPARSPWFWVPSLYFSQGIPYVIVMTMSVIMYKRLGISNTDIALYTSWLYLPWVIKPLWSPFVDITRTKRSWVVSMQFLVSLGLACAAMALRTGNFFKWSLVLFWIMAFASATHDIAADGFYMLSLTKHAQAWWVGLRSTFYRTAMIVGSGLLVVLAGSLESKNGLPPSTLQVHAIATGAGASMSVANPSAKSSNHKALGILCEPADLNIPMGATDSGEISQLIAEATTWNKNHGFLRELVIKSPEPKASDSWWGRYISQPIGRAWIAAISGPLDRFLSSHFPNRGRSAAVSGPGKALAGNAGLAYVCLTQPPPHGKTVVVSCDRRKSGLEFFGLAKGDKGFRLVEGERLVFDENNWNQRARIVFQLDPKLKKPVDVVFITSSGNIPVAWSITLFAVAFLFFAFSCWHAFMLPRPAADGPVLIQGSLTREFFSTLGSFFQKPGVLQAMAFILLYRFDEAQLSKVISPFLLDLRDKGGLALTTSQVGLAYGTFGIAALTCGGLLGGFSAARHGLRKMLPIMVIAMYLPKFVFVVLSVTQPQNFLAVCGAVALEQFGYGFGFTAFMLYLLYFADGPHKTAHYAICTGFMALGMMVPGMWSGWLADKIGYHHFFIWVIFSAIPGFLIAMTLRVDGDFGKKAVAT